MEKVPVELRGLIRSILVTVVLAALLASSVYFTGLKETLFPTLGKISLILGIFSGACFVAKTYGNKGLFHGISLGIAFFVLMLAVTLFFDASLIDMKDLISSLLLCAASGAVGGILGIGLSSD